jgi:hypothetical protein
MDNPTGSIDLKISDLMEDISIVPLETRSDFLLNLWTPFIISTDFIIAQTEKGLLQFDRQGKYIKTLAFRGNGPNEYVSFLWPLVDEKRELLYYLQYKDLGAIFCINLNTGAFSGPYRHGQPHYHPQAIDPDGYIFGFRPEIFSGPFRDSTTKSNEWSSILAYRYHPQENKLTTIKGSRNIEGGYTSLAYGNSIMFRKNDNIFFLLPNYSDTLFMIKGDKTIPQFIIKLKNKMTGQRIGGGGNAVKVCTTGKNGMVLFKTEVVITERIAGTELLDVLFLDNENKLSVVNSLSVDLFGQTIKLSHNIEKNGRITTMPRVPIVSGMFAYMVMDPVELIPLIEKLLKDTMHNSDQRIQLERLATNLDEYSNPVLIIGKMKW